MQSKDFDNNILAGSIVCKTIPLFLDNMILSASGWRTIFTEDGDAESESNNISTTGALITAVATYSFYHFYKEILGKEPTIVLGRDSRPTGAQIIRIVESVFRNLGATLFCVDIIAAPEMMAYVAQIDDIDGFFYISASHNPVGYNGFKFGNKQGAIENTLAQELIKIFRNNLSKPEIVARSIRMAQQINYTSPEEIAANRERTKEVYKQFTSHIATASTTHEAQKDLFKTIRDSMIQNPLSIIAEFNGSARSLSIDIPYLSSLGITTLGLQDIPGSFIHPIVPEGDSLTYCKEQLEHYYAQDPSFLLGYVPDCDGDRGNIVIIDPSSGKSVVPTAQEVFALVVLAELAFISTQNSEKPLAVVVNGPTSYRINEIARIYEAELFRAEVGEANVIARAREARNEGYEVRILGEGANGGNITHPAAMRDPLNTIMSLIKLLTLRTEKCNLFYDWCKKINQLDRYSESFSLIDIIHSIPPYITTSSYEKRALLQVKTADHRVLKARYEAIFLTQWEDKKDELKNRFGITHWKAYNTQGTLRKEGLGPIDSKDNRKGGLCIEFLNDKESITDVIWMRGSGTEPVFRVLADCKGSDITREAWFLNWHKEMILQADRDED